MLGQADISIRVSACHKLDKLLRFQLIGFINQISPRNLGDREETAKIHYNYIFHKCWRRKIQLFWDLTYQGVDVSKHK